MAAKNDITTESAERVLVITRFFDAPRTLVFQAWTEPEHLMRWWIPNGFTMPFCELDLRPGRTVADLAAGSGKLTRPLAALGCEVIAIEPSASMRNALRTGKEEHGATNLRIVGGVWPEVLAELGEPPVADVALIAHVGYDIEAIGPFIDAMERAVDRLCVAVLTDRSPASVADPFWPIVHGLDRVPLPALPELAELLRARGRTTEIQRVERAPRTFDSFDGLATFLRRQLWIAEDGEKERRFRAALANMARERDDDGWTLVSPPVGSIGILTWMPGD